MLSYLNKLENFIEKWQSRKRTIEISNNSSSFIKEMQQKNPPTSDNKSMPIRIEPNKEDDDNKDLKLLSSNDDVDMTIKKKKKKVLKEIQAVTNNITKNNLNNSKEKNILINITANRRMMTKYQEQPLQQAVVSSITKQKSTCKTSSVKDVDLIDYSNVVLLDSNRRDNSKENNQKIVITSNINDDDNRINGKSIHKNDCMMRKKLTNNCQCISHNNGEQCMISIEGKNTGTKDERIINLHQQRQQQHSNYLSSSILTICPSLIYVILLLTVYINHNSISALSLPSDNGSGGGTSASSLITSVGKKLSSSSISHSSSNNNVKNERAKRALDMFVKQLSANRERWTNIPDYTTNVNNNQLIRWVRRRGSSSQQQHNGPSSDGLFAASSSRPNLFNSGSGGSINRVSNIRQLMNRIRTRIGARNSIRVHNAFRDLAWRLLSSFSMPTPVIYELRRQHFYTPEDDELNDKLFNKNTTKTIRSRRQLPTTSPKRAGDDDEEEDDR